MKKISLTRGKFVLVDDDNFEELNQYNWWFNGRYAVREIKKRVIFMHRVINKTPQGMRTDHKNRNKLDNRKKNLRTVTSVQNGQNLGLKKHNTSGYSGVQKTSKANSWMARIKVNYKTIYLGCFKNKKDAILARRQGELKYYTI